MAPTMLLASLLNYSDSEEDNGRVVIKGAFQGDISMAKDVLIAQCGSLSGRVEADKVEIAGVVRGDIKAEKLVVYPSGRLYYNELYYQDLKAEEGCTMIYDLSHENRVPVGKDKEDEGKDDLDVTANGVDMNLSKLISEDETPNGENDNGQGVQNDANCPLKEAKPDVIDSGTLEEGSNSSQGDKQKSIIRKQPLFYSSY